MDELTKKVIAIKDTIKPDSPIRVYEFDYDGHILNGVELTVIE